MGSLRALFALAVVLQHCTPTEYSISGKSAVQLFYMISGFLISFVLVERKSYPDVASFYLNRFLRLYPTYAVVALLSLGFIVLSGRPASFLEVYRDAPANARVALTFANALIVGQDWLMFFDVKNAHVVFSRHIDDSSWLWHGLLVPQAWTLGVELSFYAIAPFILQRKWLMGALLAASITLRLGLIKLGFGGLDPWTYRFFPSELALFLLGAVSHQFLWPKYRKLPETILGPASVAATCLLILFTLSFIWIPVLPRTKTAALFLMFFLLLPLTFAFQHRYRFDSRIGNLSYPIYICHMLVLWAVKPVLERLNIDNLAVYVLMCVVLTIAFAMALEAWVSLPLEAIRRRVRQRARSGANEENLTAPDLGADVKVLFRET